VYRSEQTIDATIRSVLSQELNDLELIIVDDGSPDSSAAIAAAWVERDRRVRLIQQDNVGPAAARVTGAAAARGWMLSFLDADDLWLPGHLAAAHAALDGWPSRGLAFADAWILDDRSRRVSRWTALQRYRIAPKPLPATSSAEESLRRMLKLDFLTVCGVTVRRSAYERVGGFDPAFRGTDDWDLWLRIAEAGFEFVRSPTTSAVLRKRTDSLSADRELIGRGGIQVLEAAIERGLPPWAEALAATHLRLFRMELDGSGRLGALRRRYGAVRRRLGSRSLAPLLLRGSRAPSAEIEHLLEPAELSPAHRPRAM
jgi:glycosyltransferase involved in cell wall biosynthesis